MIDVKTFVEEFKFGGIECIFICFVSYFIIGYLILFTIYENRFINLDLSTQIFLAISTSFPIATISAFLQSNEEDEESTKEDKRGFFYSFTSNFATLSLFYTMAFSLFYIVKKSDLIHYDSKIDPLIGLSIIVFYCVYIRLTSEHPT